MGGVVGGACIWIYEASVWVWAQHQMPLIGIPGNATGLAFGKGVAGAGLILLFVEDCNSLFLLRCVGRSFRGVWPYFRRRRYEGR